MTNAPISEDRTGKSFTNGLDQFYKPPEPSDGVKTVSKVRFLQPTDKIWSLMVSIHYGNLLNGMPNGRPAFTCGRSFNKKCIACEIGQAFKDEDSDLARKFQPTKVSYYNVFVYSDTEEGEIGKFKILRCPQSLHDKIKEKSNDPEYRPFWDWREGCQVKLIRRGKGRTNTTYDIEVPSIDTPAIPFVKIPDGLKGKKLGEFVKNVEDYISKHTANIEMSIGVNVLTDEEEQWLEKAYTRVLRGNVSKVEGGIEFQVNRGDDVPPKEEEEKENVDDKEQDAPVKGIELNFT